MKSINLNFLIPVTFLSILSILNRYALISEVGPGVGKHILGIITGIICILVIYQLNLKKTHNYIEIVYYILVVMLFMLTINFPYFSVTLNGATGWFNFFGLYTFQPVEFMKLILIFKLASINLKHQNSYQEDISLIKKYLIYSGIPILLVLTQPDLGGALLLIFISYIMLLFGFKKQKNFTKTILITCGCLIIGFFFLITSTGQNFLIDYVPFIHSYQLERFSSWLQPFETSGGYQLSQSLIIIGSSGPFGLGIDGNLIPLAEIETDFVFSSVCGFFGWTTGLLVIFAYFYILFRTLYLASKTKDLYLKYILIGIWAMFFLQIVENIGMTIGILPVTGIVLPFLSVGITAQITFYSAIGLLLNISKVQSNDDYLNF